MMGCVLWKVLGWGYRDCVGMPVFRTENLAPPRVPIAPMRRPHPLFSFSRKRKEGGEKKKHGQQTRRKRTRRIFSVLSA